jgi:hypothetical protein
MTKRLNSDSATLGPSSFRAVRPPQGFLQQAFKRGRGSSWPSAEVCRSVGVPSRNSNALHRFPARKSRMRSVPGTRATHLTLRDVETAIGAGVQRHAARRAGVVEARAARVGPWRLAAMTRFHSVNPSPAKASIIDRTAVVEDMNGTSLVRTRQPVLSVGLDVLREALVGFLRGPSARRVVEERLAGRTCPRATS